jgi:hypothetical protein
MTRYLAVAFFAISMAACTQSAPQPTSRISALPNSSASETSSAGARIQRPSDCRAYDVRPHCSETGE